MSTKSLWAAAAAGCLALVSPALADAVKTDTLSGLTPGRHVKGYVYPKDGGPPIPLAPDTVDKDGKVTFVKPYVAIGRIDYMDAGTGARIQGLSMGGDADMLPLLHQGDRLPMFNSFFDVFTEVTVDGYTQGSSWDGQSLRFDAGVSMSLPGIRLSNADGSSFSGWATVTGWNTIEIVPAPGSVALLGVGSLCAARRRRA